MRDADGCIRGCEAGPDHSSRLTAYGAPELDVRRQTGPHSQFNAIEAVMSATSTESNLDLTGIAVRALLLYSLAEFQSGHASTIRITAEGTSFSIADNGRGHPIGRVVNGIPYLKFIYTQFDYPFESGQRSPVQLQGIGMSLVNAMCSDLALTVKKRDETLQVLFRDGRLHDTTRMKVESEETGITVSATISPQLQRGGVAVEQLQDWLLDVLACSPSLELHFNGRELRAHRQSDA
jgi:DNA gyrase/topoisomerase IV subunit B